MKTIEPQRLEELTYKACKAAFTDLIKESADETFYTFALWTDDSLQFLHPAANSEEKLQSTVDYYNKEVDPKYGNTSTLSEMRWAYGDWGHFPIDESEKHFEEINSEFQKIFDLDVSHDDFDEIINPLWDSVVYGLKRLDDEGFFGSPTERKQITLLLVGDLPEELIDSCARILNPPKVAETYINWYAD